MATKKKSKKPPKKPETVPCDNCQGSGLTKSVFSVYGAQPCRVCEGTGQLLKASSSTVSNSSTNGVA